MQNEIATGLVQDLPDHRDFLYADIFGADPAPLDWSKGCDNFLKLGIKPITQDQNGSLSCTGQATKSHVRKRLVQMGFSDEEISATPIYNAVRQPAGGASLRDAIAFAASVGSLLEKVVSSYEDGKPPSEQYFIGFTMTDALRKLALKLDRFSYRMIPGSTSSIDLYARAVEFDCGGIGGFTGTNEGWSRPVVRPPMPGEKKWGHAVSLDGYGLLDVDLPGAPKGTKCIFTKNSWGDRYGIQEGRWKGYQAIPESYFAASENTAVGVVAGIYVFNAWVLVPDAAINEDVRMQDFLKKNEGKLVMDSGPGRSGSIGWVKNGKILEASKERIGTLIANYTVEKEGVGVTPDIWDQLKAKGLIVTY